MTKFIIRNDDVAFDTSIEEIKRFCEICDKYGYKIIQAITLIGECQKSHATMTNDEIKAVSNRRFDENKEVLQFLKSRNDLIAVHGLWHTHSPTIEEIEKAKQMLIEMGFSPTYFVPPFNEGDYLPEIAGLKLCQLSLEKGENLETFLKNGEPTSPIMYLHSWRFQTYKFGCSFGNLQSLFQRLSKETNQEESVSQQNIAYFLREKNVQRYSVMEGFSDIERDLIDKFLPQPPRYILDIGCGGGRTSVELVEAGYELTAIDLSEPLIESAKKRYPGMDFRVMDASAMSFSDGSFDAAFFSFNGIDSLFPLENRVKCLKEIWRIIKPGGIFIMSTHNLIGHIFGDDDPKNIVRLIEAQKQNLHLQDWYVKYDAHGGPQYLFSAPPAVTNDQLIKAGFEVLEIRGALWQEPHIHFVARKKI